MSIHSDNPFMAASFLQVAMGAGIALLSLSGTLPQWVVAISALLNVVIHFISAYHHWHRRGHEKDS